MIDIPVLLITFNRPNPTREVLAGIRAAKPNRLYISADGPRANRAGEANQCAEVRKITEEIDWPCTVQTLFHSENLGCGVAVSKAINWFFDHEEAGVILEDDCVPHPDFFSYCHWALERYRHDRCVWQVSGNNFAAPSRLFGANKIDFIGLAQIWGWASWRDRWLQYEFDPVALKKPTFQNWQSWHIRGTAAREKLRHLSALTSGLDTWDYQWQLTVLNNYGLAVIPSGNLVTNFGDGTDATHTLDDERCRLSLTEDGFVRDVWEANVPSSNVVNRQLQDFFELQMRLRPGFVTRVGRVIKNVVSCV